MSTKDNWMFNFFTDEDGPIETRWLRMNAMKAAIVKRGNMVVQINRSSEYYKQKHTNPQDLRNAFGEFQKEIILEYN